jgi:acetyl esterase/lipase
MQHINDRRGMLGYLGAAIGVAALPACSPVGAFNTIAGRDGGSEQVAADIAFGELPRQRLDVYAPTARGASSPVVMFIYGGSWNTGRRQDYSFVGHALASKGFVTVIPDYRLVPEVLFPSFLEDGAKAMRWVQDNIARYGGDRQRVAISGHSAGAYNAAMLALDPRYLRDAGVSPGRIKALAALAGPYDFLPFDVASTQAAFGAWPNPRETQPINFARASAPPAFLATGAADTLVKPRNTLALAKALNERGARTTTRLYEGMDHPGSLLALSVRLRDRAPILDDMTQFLRQRLG